MQTIKIQLHHALVHTRHFQHLRAVRRANSAGLLWAWYASDFKYQVQLVHGRLAREYWSTGEELAENAAAAPHIHTKGVFVTAKKNLRRPIPSGGDIISELRICHAIRLEISQRPR